MKKSLKKVFGFIFLISIIAFSSLNIFLPEKSFKIFGFRFYIISYTKSMEPFLDYNDFIIVKQYDFKSLKEGDIITFVGKDKNDKTITITHEIINIKVDLKGNTYIKTQGKNLAYPDLTYVTFDGHNNTNKYIGKYIFKSSFIGHFTGYLKSPYGMFAVIVNISGLIFILRLNKE